MDNQDWKTAVPCLDVFRDVQSHFNLSPPVQNGGHFAGDIFRCIFVNEKFSILIKI